MKTRGKFITLAAGAIFILTLFATAAFAVPQTINYQGYLENSGTPVNGTVNMDFAIYNIPTGGPLLWSETQSGVTVTEGTFSVTLGINNAIDLPFDVQYYLGVNVDGDGEMTPRVELTSVPYAMRAKEVDTAPAHVHSGSDITSGSTGVQRRVAEMCVGGGSIRAIEETGGVICEPDDDTTYTAGTGIDITGNQVNVTAPLILSAPSTLATIKGTGTLSGPGVEGINTTITGYGVRGENTSGASTIYGILGSEYDGVVGYTNRAGGYGVKGESNAGSGVRGNSSDGRAVDGYTNAGYALYGNSGASGYGLYTPDRAYVGGNLELAGGTTNKVKYLSPRTHYYTVGGEGFVPVNHLLQYELNSGFGGASITSGSGDLVHSVHLPHGAVITDLRVYFEGVTGKTVGVTLQRMSLTGGSYDNLASVSSAEPPPAFHNGNDNSIVEGTVDNLNYSYNLVATSSSWSPSLKVMGAVITYTISEAP
jgi:hypothetical protein